MGANIFAQYLQPVRSVQDYMADLDKQDLSRAQLQGAQRQNALASLALQDQEDQIQQRTAENNAIRTAAAAAGGDRQKFLAALDATGLPGVIKQAQDMRKQDADLEDKKATAAKNNAEATKMNMAQALQHIGSLATPADAAASIQANPHLDDAMKSAMVASIPQDANGFTLWKAQQVLRAASPEQQARANLPNIEYKSNGKALVPVDTNSMTNQNPQPIAMYATPGEELQSQTSIKTTGMNNATSRANNADTVKKDYAVAGLNQDGSMNTGNTASLVDMLGNYQLDPKQALARAPLGQRASLIAQVQAKYPGWDETTYDAKKSSAARFANGDLGNNLRSVSVADAHLGQLGELADAMNNGNLKVKNKVENWFASQIGDPKAGNFEAIRNIVGQEVVKAIVANGGTQAERDKAEAAFDSAKSPAQIAGVIQHYRAVMKVQQQGLLAQRRAASIPDSTLPDYSGIGNEAKKPKSVGGWSYVGPDAGDK